MPDYLQRLNGDAVPWLLEDDPEQPGVRYFTLRWLLKQPATSPEVIEAQAQVMRTGPVPAILSRQQDDGSWAGASYSKYTGTTWQAIFLAELGADGRDPRVQAACEWVLSEIIRPGSGFAAVTGRLVVHCLNGELLRAMIDFGRLDDPRVQDALRWAADAILGRGTPEYRQSATSGPLFACAVNGRLPCGWGAVKELLALAAAPPRRRTQAIRDAIDAGVEFLLEHDLTKSDFPTATTISNRWFRFGFPASYSSDVLELLLALAELGRARDPRARPGIELLLSKQDDAGRWRLETTLNGKLLADVERKGQPSKWLTLRALKVLSAASSG